MLSIQYISGFFDGEGCVSIYSKKEKRGNIRTCLRASIGNTNLGVLDQIKSVHGGAIRVLKGVNSPVYLLTFTGKVAVDFIESILEFTVIKKTQIQVALHYWKFVHDTNERYGYRGLDSLGRKIKQKTEKTIQIENKYNLLLKELKKVKQKPVLLDPESFQILLESRELSKI